MTRTLTGKRAILTGASGGIGRALAAALVKAGARVALASRNAAALEAARRGSSQSRAERLSSCRPT